MSALLLFSVLPLALLASLAAVVAALSGDPEDVGAVALGVISCAVAVAWLALDGRPIRFGLGVGAVLLAGALVVGG